MCQTSLELNLFKQLLWRVFDYVMRKSAYFLEENGNLYLCNWERTICCRGSGDVIERCEQLVDCETV